MYTQKVQKTYHWDKARHQKVHIPSKRATRDYIKLTPTPLGYKTDLDNYESMLNELLWKCLYVMDSILTFAFACDICTTLGMGECPNKYWLLDLPFTLDCTDWMSSLTCKSMTTLQKWCGNCLILWIMFSCLLVTDRPSMLCHSAVCIGLQFVVAAQSTAEVH